MSRTGSSEQQQESVLPAAPQTTSARTDSSDTCIQHLDVSATQFALT